MKTQLTEGNILKNLVYRRPVSRAEVITAVSAGSQIMHMITVIIVELAMGPAVLIGHAAGENNKNRLRAIIFSRLHKKNAFI